MKKIINYLFLILTIFVIASCKDDTPKTDDSNKPEPDTPIVDVKDNPVIPDIGKDTSEKVQKITGSTIYVSPDGSMKNEGTYDSPWEIEVAFMRLTAGDTLIIKDGTYKLRNRLLIEKTADKDQSGNYLSYVTVKAENARKAILDFSSMKFDGNNRGIQLNADYYYFYGIDVKGAGDNGMYIGGSNNIIENCMFYENRDTGLQLGRAGSSYTNIKDWPHNNLIKNCTSFNNYDDETYGENADGFAAKLTVGEGNVFDGCIAYRNSDDGWDCYAKADSGNVGLTIIRNCVAFENGWTLTKHLADFKDENSAMVYTTRDGDGIGFKLGGSKMEGSILCENNIAFNNHLGGFADNSNPGVISIRNCTSYNNSVSINSDGTFGPSDGQSKNFDLARKNMTGTNSDSYNNYYGLLSYQTNQTDKTVVYSGGDTFKGSVGYSIFAKYSQADKTTKYYAFTDYEDANSYESDKAGTLYEKGLNDEIFAQLTLNYTIDQYPNFHELMRNSDGSINMGNILKIKDQTLLTYADSKPIGADLNKSSWDEYDHFTFNQPKENATINETIVQTAYDVLDVMCDPNCVFQNVKLLTLCNECKVYWSSSDPNILYIGRDEEKSLSGLTYVIGEITKDRTENKQITLTATIVYNGASLKKEFNLNIMKDKPSLGTITGHDERYIIDQYFDWQNPDITVTNASSLSGQLLKEDIDYKVEITYKYAQDKNAIFYDVSDVYTSVPGVYEVTYNVISLLNKEDKLESSFLIYISSDNAEIDLDEKGSGIEFHVTSTGVNIKAELSSTSGYMYILKSTNAMELASSIISKGTQYAITSEKVDVTFTDQNTDKYYLYVIFTNKAGSSKSKIYNEQIKIVNIKTEQEFYNFVTGSFSSTTIYSLQNDLDFQKFNWKEVQTTSTFGGLFNGNHHTISNITLNGTSPKNVNIFYKVSGGSILNTKFHNIKLIGDNSATTKVGIIGQLCGGTIDNIELRNITAFGYQGTAALVGQVIGGISKISRVSLVNDEEQSITVSGKYAGGIVGNLQKDSSETELDLTVEECYVNATIGGKEDNGGYSGGIIGRYKNDFDICNLTIYHCIVYGTIMTGKNYAGGITGGCDNGLGNTTIKYCISDINLYYAGTWIDGEVAKSVKNGSPIFGRMTVGTGIYTFVRNYGCFNDYNAEVSDGEDFDYKITTNYFWETTMKLDIVKQWKYDGEKVSLNYIEE